MNRKKIEKRVYGHGPTHIYQKGYVSPIDLFLAMGWLTYQKVEQWRFSKIPYLERVTSVNLAKLNVALKVLRKFAREQKLKPSITVYKSWGKGKKRTLQFSKSGQPHMEKLYATHYVRIKDKTHKNHKLSRQ